MIRNLEYYFIQAKQWILGDGHKTDKEAARSWFDAYAVQVVGCTPIYTCTKISSSFYKSHVQVISNKFFQPDETITGHRVLISVRKLLYLFKNLFQKIDNRIKTFFFQFTGVSFMKEFLPFNVLAL